ncbi:MAG: peroxiredoxin, partial [Hydrogenophaga sp.]|nr:peroxiredoxin [Hydrogenophaga sp.]
MAVGVNKPIPEFESQATGGIKVSNQTHLGQTVVLYFYPKDNTPGCTTEAMQFRDKYNDFVKAGAQV